MKITIYITVIIQLITLSCSEQDSDKAKSALDTTSHASSTVKPKKDSIHITPNKTPKLIAYMARIDTGIYLITRYGYKDESNHVVIKPKFLKAEDFSEGLGLVKDVVRRNDGMDSLRPPTNLPGLWGYIKPDGNYKIQPQFEKAEPFRNGKALVLKGSSLMLIDTEGNKKLKLDDVYRYGIEDISENLFRIYAGTSRIGLMDSSYNFIIPPDYQWVDEFSEGLAAFKRNDQWGYLNSKNEIIIKPDFLGATSFKNDTAFVAVERDSFAFINRNGEIIQTLDEWENTIRSHITIEYPSNFINSCPQHRRNPLMECAREFFGPPDYSYLVKYQPVASESHHVQLFELYKNGVTYKTHGRYGRFLELPDLDFTDAIKIAELLFERTNPTRKKIRESQSHKFFYGSDQLGSGIGYGAKKINNNNISVVYIGQFHR